MVVEEVIRVETSEIDSSGYMTDKAMLDRLNHVAGIHAAKVGQGKDDIERNGIAWMVMNWKLAFTRRPTVGEELKVRTWARGYNRLQAFRDCEIEDSNGEIILRAASIWVAADPVHEMVRRLTPEIMDAYEPELEKESFPAFTFPKYRKVELPIERTAEFTVTESMIDYNGHVHNSDYVTLIQKVLPQDHDDSDYHNLEITYRKEILPGATVRLEYAEANDRSWVVIRSQDGETIHTVISAWS